ncbi:MAG: hypothetical protein H7039_19265 [Bryobacteraceae bacterium]|nr:hypothetical protein [Bryobacteraceae bacterium]
MPDPFRTSYSSPLQVVLAGGSGQIGRALARDFTAGGHSVTILVRSGDWSGAINHSDLLINLAGRSVNCRYSPQNRKEMLQSRLESTLLLGYAVARVSNPPRVWMNASTATIYRHSFDRDMTESAGELAGSEPDVPSTWRFSTEVAKAWEEQFFEAEIPEAVRRIALRSAMTMTPDRGGLFDLATGGWFPLSVCKLVGSVPGSCETVEGT